MILLFLLGLHGLLMLGYAALVLYERSRLTWSHLLFAAFMPFVGEICLIAA